MEWVSKYGSLTFAQVSREFPTGGINEKGLVIEIMKLAESSCPMEDDRKTLTDLQWVQYQLDTASTVEEVLSSDTVVRIFSKSSTPKLHFFVADSQGSAAIIEFINGSMVSYSKDQIVTPVLTNDSYEHSVQFLNQCHPFGGNGAIFSSSHESLDRFARIAEALHHFSSSEHAASPSIAFDILADVSILEPYKGQITQWNIVYDINEKMIHFCTASHRAIRTIRMDAFDFEGSSPVLVLNM